jgi:uncharacterized protein (TIGR02757 family)
MTDKLLAQKLDFWYEKICTNDFTSGDPLQFPRRFKKREDIEIAAFLSATIAWGKRELILRSAEKMFALMGKSPFDYVVSSSYKKLKNRNIHRTFFESDLKYFCNGFKKIYDKYGTMENLFLAHNGLTGSDVTKERKNSLQCDVWKGFYLFREEMAKANKGEYSIHIANAGSETENGSACKRLNLALRWLVREGPVDLGLWKKINPAALYIPLDVHVARTAKKLGLLERKSNDKKAVIMLTEKLREFCPEDPVKYDFSLFGIGVTGGL